MSRLLLSFIMVVFMSTAYAIPVFTLTPVTNSLNITDGGTTEEVFAVKNTSGTTETITNLVPVPDPDGTISESVNTTDSSCSAGSSLGNDSTCSLAINVTGNKIASTELQTKVCAFDGQLCSQLATPVNVNIVASSANACSGTTGSCRVFTCQDEFDGSLTYVGGPVDVGGCAGLTALTMGNCICEKEADAGGYGHPGHWKAWLSTTTKNARANIGYLAGTIYVRAADTNTTIAAAGILLLGRLDKAIAGGGTPYTGTKDDGTVGENNCTNWSSAGEGVNGDIGDDNATGTTWTENGNQKCSGVVGIYCFEAP